MYHILYIDDEISLLDIGQKFLERTGEFKVDTLSSAKKALVSPTLLSYDAIISDYQMPELDGIEFLKIIRERSGDIPFILFTGRGREEVVINAINHGADFYLQKGGNPSAQFAELIHKIKQSIAKRKAQSDLKEAYQKIAISEEELRRQNDILIHNEHHIRESEEKFRAIFEKTHDALVLFSEEGCIDCNQQALDLFGYHSKEDFLGLHPPDVSPFLQPDGQISRDAAEEHIRIALERGVDNFEWHHQRKDKSLFFADILLSTFEFGNKNVYLSSVRDITERKRIENELQLLKISIDQSSDEVFWLDFEGNILYVNEAACQATGYLADDFYKMKIFNLEPGLSQETWDEYIKILREQKTIFITAKHRCKDGKILDVDILAVYVNKDGQEYSFAYVRNITEKIY